MDASRVRFYASTAEMANDSDLVVTGVAGNRSVAADIDAETEFTLSEFTINDVLAGDAHAPGETIIVRQLGSAGQGSPGTLIAPDGTYLLYLTASGLEGELGQQYYITGGTAGLYRAPDGELSRSASATFTQVDVDDGDTLPKTIEPSQAFD